MGNKFLIKEKHYSKNIGWHHEKINIIKSIKIKKNITSLAFTTFENNP